MNASLAQRRALRLAVGTVLALLCGEVLGWDAAFLTAVLAATILALPLPAPTFKGGFTFVLMLAVALCTGLLLLVPVHKWQMAGITCSMISGRLGKKLLKISSHP